MKTDFQSVILRLQEYWSQQGCVILQPYDLEVGAGTFHPATTLYALGPKSWKAAYVQPSRRPADGRYGENPNRLYRHHQYQVVLKPSPDNVQELYLDSLRAMGIDPLIHDIRFVEDDWEGPTLGASGLGWEVWCDGQEITQFTYFQQMGGFPCDPVTAEMTYGLERLITILQGKENLFDLAWNDPEGPSPMTYGDVFQQFERELSAYSFEHLDTIETLKQFDEAEKIAGHLVNEGLVFPAFEHCMKASHLFNLLDARGVVSVTERANFIARVRNLSRQCCALWMENHSTEKENATHG